MSARCICCFIVGLLAPCFACGAQPIAGHLAEDEMNLNVKHAAVPVHHRHRCAGNPT
jgi:hypothetical protein